MKNAIDKIVQKLQHAFPQLPNSRWVALRLLEGDQRIIEAVRSGELAGLSSSDSGQTVKRLEREEAVDDRV